MAAYVPLSLVRYNNILEFCCFLTFLTVSLHSEMIQRYQYFCIYFPPLIILFNLWACLSVIAVCMYVRVRVRVFRLFFACY